jgi:hypothetical protein
MSECTTGSDALDLKHGAECLAGYRIALDLAIDADVECDRRIPSRTHFQDNPLDQVDPLFGPGWIGL